LEDSFEKKTEETTMRKIILALVITLFTASFVAADTIYLRDGRQVRGTLLGFINGRFVVRVDRRYQTGGGAPVRNPGDAEGELQYFRPTEVERIEIEGRSLDEMRFETSTVLVPLESNWMDTGVDLRRNEKVQITASGTILAGRTRITPDGLRSTDPNSPLPRAAEGKLIGSIGNDRDAPIFELGSNIEFTADRDGRLYLTANRGSYTDARGNFSVQIRSERDLTALDTGDDTAGRRRNRPGVIRSRDRLPGDGTGRNRTPREVTLEVPGTSRGTDTGLDVRAGDQITFNASGVVVAGRRIGNVGPEGGRATGFGSIVGTKPVPTAGPGALIGYIRTTDGQTSAAFLIGTQLIFTATADGRLLLAINDDDYSDNSGSFSVKITR
jgi:hypothetical protein